MNDNSLVKYCNKCKTTKPITDFGKNRYCKQCCCTYFKNYRKQNPGILQLSRKNNLVAHLLYGIKNKAHTNNIPFDLSERDIVIPETCPVLGIPLVPGVAVTHDGSPTIDRITPALGYVKGNTCVISHKANRIKNNGTLEDLKQVVKYLKKHTKR